MFRLASVVLAVWALPAAAAEPFKLAGDNCKITFVGSKADGKHEGGFKELAGTATAAAGEPTTLKIELTIEAASVYSDDPKLTGHLKAPDFFSVKEFPALVFKLTKVEKTADGYTQTGAVDHARQDQAGHAAEPNHRDRLRVDHRVGLQCQAQRVGDDLRHGQGRRRGEAQSRREGEAVMAFPAPPPSAEVADKLQALVAPAAAGGALGVVLLLALSRRLAWPAAALGALGGAALANWGRNYFAWGLGERSFQAIAPAAFILTLVGVVTQPLALIAWRPRLVTLTMWALRVAATVFLAGWLAPEWADRLMLAGLISLQWATLDAVARPLPGRRGNRSAQVVLLQSLVMTLSGVLVLYAHSLRLADFLNMAGAAALGVALAGYAADVDVRGAIPLGAVTLPGVLFITHQTTTSLVPLSAYALAAAAPLGLLPWVAPRLARRDGWPGVLCRFAVVLGLVAAALMIAGRVETLPWEEEW